MRRATETPKRQRRRHSGTVIAISLIVVFSALWGVYWYGASQIGAAALDRVAAAAVARGYTASCEDPAGGGFPLSVDLSCRRASLIGSEGMQMTFDGFVATAALYRPWSIRSTATGPLAIRFSTEGPDTTANWQTAETTVDASLGGLSALAAHIEGLQLDLPPIVQSLEQFSLTRAEVAVAPAADDDYRLSALARGIALKSENDRNLPAIDLDADLSALDFGGSLGLDPRQALSGWVATGGNLRVDGLAIVAEDVSAQANGTLALSQAGTLSGELNLTIAGLEALPDLVAAFYPDARDKTAQIVAAAVAFTRPIDTPTGPARQLTLLVRDSVVSIGILPIGVVPPVAF